MLSGHLPAGSRILVLSPDDRWKEMVQARNRTLYESWEVVEAMDVPTAKRWSQEGGTWTEGGKPMAVVFFHDGVVRDEWSYELFHALTILLHFGAGSISNPNPKPNPNPSPNPNPNPGPGPQP